MRPLPKSSYKLKNIDVQAMECFGMKKLVEVSVTQVRMDKNVIALCRLNNKLYQCNTILDHVFQPEPC